MTDLNPKRWSGKFLKNMYQDSQGNDDVSIQVPMKFLVNKNKFLYEDLDVMALREFTEKNETSSRTRNVDSTPEKVEQGPRRDRFVIWLCKGPDQVNKLIRKYFGTEFVGISNPQRKYNFEAFVIKRFYELQFDDSERAELNKLNDAHDVWHLLLIGHPEVRQDLDEWRWQVIAACSFKILDDLSVYVKWIATSNAAAALEK
jgi:hypothetical protein